MAAAAAILATAVLSGRDDVRGRDVGLDDPAELPNSCQLASADWESKAIVSTRAQQTEDTRQQPPPWPMPLPCTSPLPDSTADANCVAVAANTITYVASHVPRRQTSLAPDMFVVFRRNPGMHSLGTRLCTQCCAPYVVVVDSIHVNITPLRSCFCSCSFSNLIKTHILHNSGCSAKHIFYTTPYLSRGDALYIV